MELTEVCRLCGDTSSNGYHFHNVFGKDGNGQQLLQLIKQCLPILIYRTDPLSKNICDPCYVKLQELSTFRNKTITINDSFTTKLTDKTEDDSVQLYMNTLENAYQNDNLQMGYYRNVLPVKNCGTQISIPTHSKCTTTTDLEESSSRSLKHVKSLTILTPNKINEKTQEDELVISNPRKKRRLAGPLSKTRPHLMVLRSPASLLQIALKQININLNLIDTNYDESDQFHNNLLEPSDREVLSDFDDPFYGFHIDMNERVICNYCMQSFPNICDLAEHEIVHIKVDMGGQVDSPLAKGRPALFYQNYMKRMMDSPSLLNVPDLKVKLFSPASPATKVPGPKSKTEAKPKSAPFHFVPSKPVLRKNPTRKPIDKHMLEEPEDPEENGLFIPDTPLPPSDFKLINNEVTINGIPLKTLDKKERRLYFKDVLINGIKRKFCPVCRHTFKDNWAIENHYLSNICQYTCKYCGRKFKYQKEIFADHLKQHIGEPLNKIFGPVNRKMKFKKKKKFHPNNRTVLIGQTVSPTKKVKPIKIKQLMQKKFIAKQQQQQQHSKTVIKTEPGKSTAADDSVTLEASSSNSKESYQAFFCRKCFKVFFKVDQYNAHVQMCTGTEPITKTASDSNSNHSGSRNATPEITNYSKRPVRSCVKELSHLNTDSDTDSLELPLINKKSGSKTPKVNIEHFDCTECTSSFSSRSARNSHMRIHKIHHQVKNNHLKKVAPKSHAVAKATNPQKLTASKIASVAQNPDLRMSNLNSTVARLVQNNPHLTIRSYSKSQPSQPQQPQQQSQQNFDYNNSTGSDSSTEQRKRAYKCSDCEEKFENKSLLYYHKVNACVIKKHYECAFCHRKFGSYEQYNSHMIFVHPE